MLDWLNAQVPQTLYLSAITVAELRAGVARLPSGKRKTGLYEDLEHRLLPLFAQRVLAFDIACSQPYAELLAKTRQAGRVIAGADAYIAATAVTHGFAIATRDVLPFVAAGLKVINPWQP